jgi:hypothetical protein
VYQVRVRTPWGMQELLHLLLSCFPMDLVAGTSSPQNYFWIGHAITPRTPAHP